MSRKDDSPDKKKKNGRRISFFSFFFLFFPLLNWKMKVIFLQFFFSKRRYFFFCILPSKKKKEKKTVISTQIIIFSLQIFRRWNSSLDWNRGWDIIMIFFFFSNWEMELDFEWLKIVGNSVWMELPITKEQCMCYYQILFASYIECILKPFIIKLNEKKKKMRGRRVVQR